MLEDDGELGSIPGPCLLIENLLPSEEALVTSWSKLLGDVGAQRVSDQHTGCAAKKTTALIPTNPKV